MSILYKDSYTLQKTKSYNKNCWSLIYNMNYGLKSRLHKSQIYKKKKKISSGLAVVLLKFSGVITLTHVICPSLKMRMNVKRFNEVELYSPLEVKINSMAR